MILLNSRRVTRCSSLIKYKECRFSFLDSLKKIGTILGISIQLNMCLRSVLEIYVIWGLIALCNILTSIIYHDLVNKMQYQDLEVCHTLWLLFFLRCSYILLSLFSFKMQLIQRASHWKPTTVDASFKNAWYEIYKFLKVCIVRSVVLVIWQNFFFLQK